ncbi:hypothetical protein BDZ89DRAFT_921591, partial [Hymenopellis radicata]
PRWALVIQDAMRNQALSTYKSMNPKILVNTFLQTWDANKQDLPSDMKRILKVAKDHNLILDAITISSEARREMPIWLHQGWSPLKIRRTNDKYARCLQTNHQVMTVGDACRIAEGDGDPPDACENPDQCRRRAAQLLDALDPKWDPRVEQSDETEPEIAGERVPKQANPAEGTKDLYRIFTEGMEL